jgi:type IV pilus assembly protein PilO
MNAFLEYIQGLETSRKVALAIIAPLLILIAYYFMLLAPRLQRTEGLREHITSMLEERERKALEASMVAQRQQEVDALDKQLKLALSRLPDEKEIPELLSSISSIGRDAGLDILVFRQRQEAYQWFYAEVPVEMQVRGSFHQVATFLDRVGKLDRIVNVHDITMKEPKVISDEVVIQANSLVTTYRFLSEAERDRLVREKKLQPPEGVQTGEKK